MRLPFESDGRRADLHRAFLDGLELVAVFAGDAGLAVDDADGLAGGRAAQAAKVRAVGQFRFDRTQPRAGDGDLHGKGFAHVDRVRVDVELHLHLSPRGRGDEQQRYGQQDAEQAAGAGNASRHYQSFSGFE